MKASAPGKAFIAGEYAVMMPNQPAIIASVNRRVVVQATPARVWGSQSAFVMGAIAALRHKYKIESHDIRTTDDLTERGVKLGLGGSAAVTVATVFALAPPTASQDDLWALADEVHRTVQEGRGSGGDIAASVLGGVIRYTSTPRKAVPIVVHSSFRFLLAWSGTSVRTSPRVSAWVKFVKTRTDRADAFARLSAESVHAIEQALISGDHDALRSGIGRAREALLGLESDLELKMETPELRAAIDAAEKAGACGKISGSGGGDCAIILSFGDDGARAATRAIEAVGLKAMPFVPAGGVQVER